MDRRKSIRLTPEESRQFMEEGRTAMLATNGRDGYPHLIAMWYAVKDGDLVMTTYGRSQKAVNIRRDPRATMMWEAGTSYNKLRGLMIRGRAEIVEDPKFTYEVLRLVGKKMSGISSVSPEQNAALEAQATKRVVIRFHPEKFSSWDHSKM
ncbi:MAG TPA: PPOX class F420-dependent oxidoreductase [Candidatus Binataceae bacterium]|jgi:PPOX class probable F420-dependent enzyme|nr:PPOX class F420-dependent oxidoreductase [Candidatus Binataceae bacterium]